MAEYEDSRRKWGEMKNHVINFTIIRLLLFLFWLIKHVTNVTFPIKRFHLQKEHPLYKLMLCDELELPAWPRKRDFGLTMERRHTMQSDNNRRWQLCLLCTIMQLWRRWCPIQHPRIREIIHMTTLFLSTNYIPEIPLWSSAIVTNFLPLFPINRRRGRFFC